MLEGWEGGPAHFQSFLVLIELGEDGAVLKFYSDKMFC